MTKSKTRSTRNGYTTLLKFLFIVKVNSGEEILNDDTCLKEFIFGSQELVLSIAFKININTAICAIESLSETFLLRYCETACNNLYMLNKVGEFFTNRFRTGHEFETILKMNLLFLNTHLAKMKNILVWCSFLFRKV